MPKAIYTLIRAAVIDETYEIEADSEEEALEIAYNGQLGDPVKTEFIDWRDDSYEIANVDVIEPLYRMVKDYKSVDSLA